MMPDSGVRLKRLLQKEDCGIENMWIVVPGIQPAFTNRLFGDSEGLFFCNSSVASSPYSGLFSLTLLGLY